MMIYTRVIALFVSLLTLLVVAPNASAAEDKPPSLVATYLGNEGVLIAQGGSKIVFDPLFGNTYGAYQPVPEELRTALLSGQPPFDGLQALFISHAHGDHFSANDIVQFMGVHGEAYVVGPAQAIDSLMPEFEAAKQSLPAERLVRIDLDYGSQPLLLDVGGLRVEAVRIAHAGGEGRRDIQNLLYRVKLVGEAVVMHLGDADPDLRHYRPYDEHWQKRGTDLALPPYWFFGIPGGEALLSKRLNTSRQIGVHVPVEVPSELRESGADYFSEPSEQRVIDVPLPAR